MCQYQYPNVVGGWCRSREIIQYSQQNGAQQHDAQQHGDFKKGGHLYKGPIK